MRTVLVWSIIGIGLATALLGMSEITQSASAFTVFSKGGFAACTDCSSNSNGHPAAASPGGEKLACIGCSNGKPASGTIGFGGNGFVPPFSDVGGHIIWCPGGKPGAATSQNGRTCAP